LSNCDLDKLDLLKILNDGRVPSSDCNFFGGVAETSMEEDEQGAHIELVDSLKVHARCGE